MGQNPKEGHLLVANRSFQNHIPNDAAVCGMLTLCARRCAEHCPSRAGTLNADSPGGAVKTWAREPDCPGLNLAPPPLAVGRCPSYSTSLPQFSPLENGFNKDA